MSTDLSRVKHDKKVDKNSSKLILIHFSSKKYPNCFKRDCELFNLDAEEVTSKNNEVMVHTDNKG
ncbi:hypothetical protein BI308_20930 [Roseofilum reptotaenium AO1-A]|uniref:Uncharacterized protein n=1 Tax=Roseofilum reptotaenium AO1-A TaxID=1925591 RepID=A0A1L9QLV2_9CYAN|nr:hypothetical protein BI308_20930 [Roseofilum reptotaenium AO1-A]